MVKTLAFFFVLENEEKWQEVVLPFAYITFFPKNAHLLAKMHEYQILFLFLYWQTYICF